MANRKKPAARPKPKAPAPPPRATAPAPLKPPKVLTDDGEQASYDNHVIRAFGRLEDEVIGLKVMAQGNGHELTDIVPGTDQTYREAIAAVGHRRDRMAEAFGETVMTRVRALTGSD